MRISDWSDVCSSDLTKRGRVQAVGTAHPADRRALVTTRPGAIAECGCARPGGLGADESERGAADRCRFVAGRHAELADRGAAEAVGGCRQADRRRVITTGDALGTQRRGAKPRGRAEEAGRRRLRSEEHTSELQALMRISSAAYCLNNKT